MARKKEKTREIPTGVGNDDRGAKRSKRSQWRCEKIQKIEAEVRKDMTPWKAGSMMSAEGTYDIRTSATAATHPTTVTVRLPCVQKVRVHVQVQYCTNNDSIARVPYYLVSAALTR